jgi:hypothetical protein
MAFLKDAKSDGDSYFKQANNLQEWCWSSALHVNVDVKQSGGEYPHI